jgi:mono/diheme cytochrome c family protein
MQPKTLLISAAFAAVALASTGSAQTQDRVQLRPPSAFASIQDAATRSQALFTEAAKVITHPRCMNCHPATDRPLQGNDRHPHQPPAWRGADGLGVAGNHCGSCHTERNVNVNEGADYRSIPGHPRWQLAPIEMAWEGKSLGDICRQLKDPNRNGGRTLALLHEHVAKDDLVAWGWQPGTGREPAPGTQELAGQLVQAWIDTGAQCP